MGAWCGQSSSLAARSAIGEKFISSKNPVNSSLATVQEGDFSKRLLQFKIQPLDIVVSP